MLRVLSSKVYFSLNQIDGIGAEWALDGKAAVEVVANDLGFSPIFVALSRASANPKKKQHGCLGLGLIFSSSV